jgi:hypothetical protein
MQFIKNKKEQGTVVILDDTSFVDCTFTNCQILYSGGDYSWTRTNFVNCQIGLQGHAARTAALLQSFGWKPLQPGTAPAPPPTGAVN